MVKVENFFFFNKDVAQHLKEKRKKEKKRRRQGLLWKQFKDLRRSMFDIDTSNLYGCSGFQLNGCIY